jgi:hypothetical protein
MRVAGFGPTSLQTQRTGSTPVGASLKESPGNGALRDPARPDPALVDGSVRRPDGVTAPWRGDARTATLQASEAVEAIVRTRMVRIGAWLVIGFLVLVLVGTLLADAAG